MVDLFVLSLMNFLQISITWKDRTSGFYAVCASVYSKWTLILNIGIAKYLVYKYIQKKVIFNINNSLSIHFN